MTAPIRWILFDWGNVLVDYRPLGFPRLAARLGVELDSLVSALGAQALTRRLCVGRASPQDLSNWLFERYGIRLSEADFVELFAEDVARRLPGADDLVAALSRRFRLGILSNTFFGHWHQLTVDPFYRAFERTLASHLLGAEKPDRRIYELALAELGCPAHEVVFIDDREENATAARAAGMHAIHSTSIAQTRAGLTALACLSDADPELTT